MAFKRGQVLTIPVLKRHITHSSGECEAQNGNNISQSCVMADAIRDAFPGATKVSVSTSNASFVLDGQEVSLTSHQDMVSVVRTFDDFMDGVYEGNRTLKDAIASIWSRASRKVHATVAYVYNA